MFDGDPLNFMPFMRAFEHGIEDKTSSHQDRLYYLEQYTSGQPKDLVRSCLHMEARRGYAEAKKLLKEHFGNVKGTLWHHCLHGKSLELDKHQTE